MPIIWPHTGLTVPDTNAPRVGDLTITDGAINALVVDDHEDEALGCIVTDPEAVAGTGLAFVPYNHSAERTMARFLRATEELNAGPSLFGGLLGLMVEEYRWQLEIDRAHRDGEHLVRYVCNELTWQTWHVDLGESEFPDYYACWSLLTENPLGWADSDVVETHLWRGAEDGWVIVYRPPEPQE